MCAKDHAIKTAERVLQIFFLLPCYLRISLAEIKISQLRFTDSGWNNVVTTNSVSEGMTLGAYTEGLCDGLCVCLFVTSLHATIGVYTYFQLAMLALECNFDSQVRL